MIRAGPLHTKMATERADSAPTTPAADDLPDADMDEQDAGADPAVPAAPAAELAIATAPPAACAGPAAQAGGRAQKTRRAKKPSIDLDAAIQEAAMAMKAAQKRVQQAKTLAKNERRKKQRLVKKAANLQVEDLERIAVLKRCGLVIGDVKKADGAAKVADNTAAASSATKGSSSPASASNTPHGDHAASSA